MISKFHFNISHFNPIYQFDILYLRPIRNLRRPSLDEHPKYQDLCLISLLLSSPLPLLFTLPPPHNASVGFCYASSSNLEPPVCQGFARTPFMNLF